MDKVKKLRRYTRKDYTQLVDFPVEIVGRDGVVRRYSFEASVRLYQRRIASAASRYEDNEVVDAEVVHCRRRIQQLRKSYFHRYGWSGFGGEDAPIRLAGEFAGELAAFLRRFYGVQEAPSDLAVSWVADQDHGQTWFVRKGQEHSYVLYLFRFEHYGACAGRESFFQLLRLMQQNHGMEVERLVAFHHTADCGLVLTSTGPGAAPDPVEFKDEGPELQLFERHAEDPYALGMALLNEGDPTAALKRFQAAQLANPWRRHIAVATSVVADMLAQPEESEAACRIGLHHFPGNATLLFHLALALTRQGRLAEARTATEQALASEAGLFAPRALLALLELKERRYGACRRHIQRALAADARADDDAVALLGHVRAMLRARLVLFGTALAALLIGVLLTGLDVAGGGALLAFSVAASGISWAVSRRLLDQLVVDERLRRVRLLPPEGLGNRGPRFDDILN